MQTRQSQGRDVATSPTALRILDAAKTILSERGYSKLTLQAIEEESGEYRALVAYYFGSKQGLVDAIIDSLMEAEDEALRERLAEIDEPGERVRALIDEQRQISADWRGFRAFYELLPQHHARRAAARGPRRRLRQVARAGPADPGGRPDRRRSRPRRRGHGPRASSPLSASPSSKGLAVQYAADQEHFDHEGTYRLWEDMVLAYLREKPQA